MGTVLKVTPGTNGTITLTHAGQEYKCTISSNETKTPDVVLGASGEDVKIFLSDNLGNNVEVTDGRVGVGLDGNVVVVDQTGTSIKLEDGGLVEVSTDGDVNINLPDEGSVKVNNGNVDVKTPDGAVKVDGGKVNVSTPNNTVNVNEGAVQINTPETGDVKIDDSGVSIPSADVNIEY
jgi:hypothetical protein